MLSDDISAEACAALADLLAAACARLEEIAGAGQYDQILFLSREGLLLLKAWQVLGMDRERYRYLLASRRSLGLSACFSLADFFALLESPFHPQPLNSLLHSRFGISGIDGVTGATIVSRHDKPLIKKVLRRHFTELTNRTQQERNAYLDYLHSRGIVAGKRYLLVDIGYNGTYQRSLERIMPGAKFDSFCLAAFSGAIDLVRQGRMQTLFNEVRNNRLKRDPISRNVAVLELLMMACHPSFLNVHTTGNARRSFRFDDATLVAPLEILSIQCTALEMLRNRREKRGMADAAAALTRFEQWLANPDAATVRWLGKLWLDDRFGGRINRPLIAANLLTHDGALPFKRAVELYGQSDWRDGALVLLRQMSIEKPISAPRRRWPQRFVGALRKTFRSRDAFERQCHILLLKAAGKYEAPMSEAGEISAIVKTYAR